MKLSEEEFKKATKQDSESLLKKLNQSMEKMLSVLQEKNDSKLQEHLVVQQQLLAQIVSAKPQDNRDIKQLAEAILQATKQPISTPQNDNNIIKSIDKLTKTIQEKPSSFIFEVQRLKSGAIDKVLVKPAK